MSHPGTSLGSCNTMPTSCTLLLQDFCLNFLWFNWSNELSQNNVIINRKSLWLSGILISICSSHTFPHHLWLQTQTTPHCYGLRFLKRLTATALVFAARNPWCSLFIIIGRSNSISKPFRAYVPPLHSAWLVHERSRLAVEKAPRNLIVISSPPVGHTLRGHPKVLSWRQV